MLAALLCSLGGAAAVSASFERGVGVGRELLARAGLASARPPPSQNPRLLKQEVLDALGPFGDPALGVPAEVAARVDGLCKQLEAYNPTIAPATRGIDSQDGRWAVRWSNAPPPSNGAIGPIRGAAFQTVRRSH